MHMKISRAYEQFHGKTHSVLARMLDCSAVLFSESWSPVDPSALGPSNYTDGGPVSVCVVITTQLLMRNKNRFDKFSKDCN